MSLKIPAASLCWPWKDLSGMPRSLFILKVRLSGVLDVFTAKPLAINPHGNTSWKPYPQTAIAIENSLLFENLQKSNTELASRNDTTLEGWSRALDLRTRRLKPYRRVTELTLRLAKRMEIPGRETHLYPVGVPCA
jgi:hypothetical protein